MVSTRQYDWDEVRSFILKQLKGTRHIMTYGTIGSCNIEHDIDTIIAKKPSSLTSKFYKEIHDLLDSVNSYFNRKYGINIIRTSMLNHEEEIKIISNYNKDKDLLFQVMTYISMPQIKMHWAPDLIKDEKIELKLKKIYTPLIGSTSSLFSKPFSKMGKYDALYLRLNDNDRINSNYPEEYLLRVMNKIFDFILRKKLNLQPLEAKNEREVRVIFYKICDILDKMEGRIK